MTIHLPENLESSIREAVHSGQFPSIDDAMAEAARPLLSQLKQRLLTPPTAGEDPAVAPQSRSGKRFRSSPPASPTKYGINCPPTCPSITITISTARRSDRSNEITPVLRRS